MIRPLSRFKFEAILVVFASIGWRCHQKTEKKRTDKNRETKARDRRRALAKVEKLPEFQDPRHKSEKEYDRRKWSLSICLRPEEDVDTDRCIMSYRNSCENAPINIGRLSFATLLRVHVPLHNVEEWCRRGEAQN